MIYKFTWQVCINVVYGQPNGALRREPLALLRQIIVESEVSWCIVVDMNNVLSQNDKRGGQTLPSVFVERFPRH